MNPHTDITETFGTLYHPVKALLIYNNHEKEKHGYVEAYDIDTNGSPINAHRLSVRESIALAKALDTTEELKRTFLKPTGLLPKNVLYINPDRNGYVIWYTPPQKQGLYFRSDLGIINGKASLPALIWRANRTSLWVYALTDENNITTQTPLFRAPFFNIGQDGKVCMGTVNVNLPANCGLEEFISTWQDYFFNSYFSHLLDGNPVKGNIVQLWQGLVGKRKAFPTEELTAHSFTLKKLIP
jgi:PRTRC genetic system protein B